MEPRLTGERESPVAFPLQARLQHGGSVFNVACLVINVSGEFNAGGHKYSRARARFTKESRRFRNFDPTLLLSPSLPLNLVL